MLNQNHPSCSGPTPQNHPEAGSAYVITLMVMFVLTAVGLSLTLITSLEGDLSASQRVVEKTFYANESGLAVATAQILHDHKTDSVTVRISEQNGPAFDSQEKYVHEIQATRAVPIQDMPCDLCQVNSGDATFHTINHALTTTSSRLTAVDGEVTSRSTIAAMVQLQPWQRSAAAVPTTADDVAGVKF